jgi:hypothetical protein
LILRVARALAIKKAKSIQLKISWNPIGKSGHFLIGIQLIVGHFQLESEWIPIGLVSRVYGWLFSLQSLFIGVNKAIYLGEAEVSLNGQLNTSLWTYAYTLGWPFRLTSLLRLNGQLYLTVELAN